MSDPLKSLWTVAGAVAGILPFYAGLFNKDPLEVEMEEAWKDIGSAKRQIEHWQLLCRGYAHVITASSDENEKKSAQVQLNMLRFCIGDQEREIADREAFIKSKEKEITERQNVRKEAKLASQDMQDKLIREDRELIEDLKKSITELSKRLRDTIAEKDATLAENAKLAERLLRENMNLHEKISELKRK